MATLKQAYSKCVDKYGFEHGPVMFVRTLNSAGGLSALGVKLSDLDEPEETKAEIAQYVAEFFYSVAAERAEMALGISACGNDEEIVTDAERVLAERIARLSLMLDLTAEPGPHWEL